MDRRTFLTATGAALPVATLAGELALPRPLCRTEIRFAVLQELDLPDDLQRASRARELAQLCSGANRPDIVFLQEQPGAAASLQRLACQFELHIAALGESAAVLLTRDGALHRWTTDSQHGTQAIAHTDIGDVLAFPGKVATLDITRASQAGADWVFGPNVADVARRTGSTLIAVSPGRAFAVLPPGCPDACNGAWPYRAEACIGTAENLLRAPGASPQVLLGCAPIAALRARRRAA